MPAVREPKGESAQIMARNGTSRPFGMMARPTHDPVMAPECYNTARALIFSAALATRPQARTSGCRRDTTEGAPDE